MCTRLQDYGAYCVLYASVSYTLALAVLTLAFFAYSANTGKEARFSFAAPVNDKHWSRKPEYETYL